MSASPPYLEVAVAAPLPQTLTYAALRDGRVAKPGQRVLVPLSGRLLTGYVLALSEEKPEFRLKPIADLLDDFPVFPEKLVPFFRWVARYYHYPIGEVIRGALPGGLTSQSGRRLKITEAGLHYFQREQPQLIQDTPWLANLTANKKLSAATVRKLWRGKERRLIEQWAEQGLLTVEQIISGASIGQKTESCVLLAQEAASPETLASLKPSEAKTLALLEEMRTPAAQGIPRRELTALYRGAGKPLAALAAKGLISLVERPVYRDPFGETPPFFPRPAQLTVDQENALAQLNPAIRQKKYSAFLLHGVTGSGKTEVYLQAAETTLALGRSVLVLVPEIALATQLEAHFLSRFGETVALLHSGLARGERFDQWQRVVSGEARIVIGARSAIFAPLGDPGLIIVDEEHDGAYKQEDSLRYQGRDLALLRGSQGGATVLLGSATPSLISYQHALSGKYTLLTLPARIENRPLPQVELVDLQAVNTVSGRPPLFSPQLKQALRATLSRGEQSLVFLNRRGFAGCMLCSDCGQAVQCPHCRITLTLHKGRGELVCHYCGFATNSRTVCTNCRSLNLAPIGFGTERIEEELTGMFPKARIARLDHDTTRNRQDFLRILRAVHEREVDILVGTQMITKGHHFPHVTLVGIVWADAGLGMPDYKGGERTFQLLAQVTGRAGRGEQPGKVIVQTHQPTHYSIAAARDHDYPRFFAKEMGLRKALGYPPFSRLINLVLDGEQEEGVQSRASLLAAKGKSLLPRYRRTAILGPAPAPLARLRGRFRWQILLKGPDLEELHGLCLELEQEQSRLGAAVNLSVDVDPENML
ncbi:replication restart helicase PriA [Thiovibrio frasassiensis]|uniref:Replication restart protein PriA n=1 Tax=Thiovibrio frasassiensis TaxID=2984131 RepID=A0A9X4MGL3_9BACT|nr:primosomal protein N' [Thiovibrio frasassiensis]MDG4476013.1 primosomal protein N' [Thiovibrio frasassiensis]